MRFRRFGRRFAHLSAPILVLALAMTLVGFIRISFGPTTPGFFWAQQPISFVIQADGSDDVPDGSDHSAIRLSFQTWNELPDSFVEFQEDLTADASRTDFGATDIHLVLFDEDGSTGLFPDGSAIIALTPILASTGDGAVIDADIVFNGRKGFQTTGATLDRFDVQSVATHEIGHVVGLDHSGGPKSSMFSSVLSGEIAARSLSRDEEAGATFVYPGGGARGRIAGAVTLQGGGVAAFTQVVAVDAISGEYASQDLTDGFGGFALEGLRAGTYDVYVETVDGPFNLADTIGYTAQTSTELATTFFPGNPVAVSGGVTSPASWSASPTNALNITKASGGTLFGDGVSRDLIVSGTNLDSVVSARVTGSNVSVDGITMAGPILVLSLTAQPNAIPGTRCVELTTAAGESAVLTAGVDVFVPDPTIGTVAPTTLQPTGGDNMTITGTGFLAGSKVVIGGELATNVTFMSTTQLRAVSPPSTGSILPVDVVVIRPDGREVRASGAVVYPPFPIPQSVDPAIGPTTGGTTHTIRGSGFAIGVQVTFGDRLAQILSVTGNEIRVLLPPQPAGTVDVSVTFGTDTGVLPSGFTYVEGVPPQVTSFTPTSGPTGGGTLVTISGTGFDPDAEVRFGGVAATSVSVSSGNQLTAVAPAQSSGGVSLRVTNPATGLVSVASGLYSYGNAAAPPPSGGGGSSSDCRLSPAPDSPGIPGLPLLALVTALLLARRRESRPS